MAANADLSTAWNLIVWATASRALPERAEGASNSFPRGARSLFFACSQLNESGMVNATPNSPPPSPLLSAYHFRLTQWAAILAGIEVWADGHKTTGSIARRFTTATDPAVAIK